MSTHKYKYGARFLKTNENHSLIKNWTLTESEHDKMWFNSLSVAQMQEKKAQCFAIPSQL